MTRLLRREAGKHFKITSDIDMSGVTDFLGISTAAYGAASSASTYYFGGILDGGGHRIKNMKINGVTFGPDGKVESAAAAKSRQYVGFIGVLGKNAEVRNLIIDASCYVAGYNAVGGLVGYSNGGTVIENCVNEAQIDCYNNYGGGIVGRSVQTLALNGEIRNCVNKGTVRVISADGGGIVGNISYGDIAGCVNAGNIFVDSFNSIKDPGNGSNAGGIVGNGTGMSVSDCLNGGQVSASLTTAGGIVGIAGYKSDRKEGRMKNCVNYGPVTGGVPGMRGVFIGMNGSAGANIYQAENCVYDSQIWTGACAGMPCGGSGFNNGYIGKTTSEMTSGASLAGFGDLWQFEKGLYPMLKVCADDYMKRSASTYFILPQGITTETFVGTATVASGIKVSASVSNWLSASGSSISATKTDVCQMDTVTLVNGDFSRVFPVCQIQIPFKGQGTEADPYQLTSFEDFKALQDLTTAEIPLYFAGRHFKMMNDIDMKQDTTFHGIAVRNITNSYKNYYFAGHIDGGGHTISNLKTSNLVFDTGGTALSATKGSYSYVGLIGTLASCGSVRNLNLDASCEIDGYQRVASIVGFASENAVVDNCSSAATVRGYYSECAGIVSYLCGSAANPGIVSNCLFSGKVLANRDFAGGIVASHRGIAKNCVNTGVVKSECYNGKSGNASAYQNIGGIVGGNYGTVEDCANYGNVYGQQKVGGIAGLINSNYDLGTVSRCFNSGVIFETGEPSELFGCIAGGPASDKTVIDLKDNYYDSQLTVVKGGYNAKEEAGCTALSTSKLTDGAKIEKLTSFTFAEGYYPIPTVFAGNEDVKAAAATYFLLPEAETIANIKSAAKLNEKMPLEATFAHQGVFELKGFRFYPVCEGEGNTLLTLKNGTFSIDYPISTSGATGVDQIFGQEDEVVNVSYYGIDGTLIASPAKGSVVVKIETTSSGRRKVSKVAVN